MLRDAGWNESQRERAKLPVPREWIARHILRQSKLSLLAQRAKEWQRQGRQRYGFPRWHPHYAKVEWLN
jgi:hypothetical protein